LTLFPSDFKYFITSFELHEFYSFEWLWLRLFWRVLCCSIYTSPLLWGHLTIICLNLRSTATRFLILNQLIFFFVKLATNLKIGLSLIIAWRFVQLTYFSFFVYFIPGGVIRRINDHIWVVNFKKRCCFLSKVRNIIRVTKLLLFNFVSHDIVQILCIVIHLSIFLVFWILMGVV